MNTLVVKRPKDKEKNYDETKIKVYVNNNLVGKLQQNDTIEINLEGNSFEIQAKVFGYKSLKEKFEINEKVELEIIRNPIFKNSSFIIFLFPIIFTILYNSEIYWARVLVIALTIIIFFWFGYLYLKYRKNAIVIRKV